MVIQKKNLLDYIKGDKVKQKLNAIYLDWYNNFVTIDCFADYYNISIDKAERIINIGRKINHKGTK